MIKASIIGVTGYTGVELLRILVNHPHVEIAYLTSRQHENAPIGDVFQHLSHLDLRVTNTAHETVAAESDVVFLALPHKTAQDVVAALHGKTKIIDLSADYRLDDAAKYERYYGLKHNHEALMREVVYGAPEIIGRAAIAAADTVANPGCFALLAQMMLFPFKGQIERADIFAITGSSGSGKSASDGTHHPIRSHNIKSYNINIHRHIPEIIRGGGIEEDQLNFVPTSGPFVRGIFAQGFLNLEENGSFVYAQDDKKYIQDKLYSDQPFVRIVESVQLAHVVGSNFVDLSFEHTHDGRVLVQGALDNLVKGAAGTAVQNMNLMFKLDETAGLLSLSPVYP